MTFNDVDQRSCRVTGTLKATECINQVQSRGQGVPVIRTTLGAIVRAAGYLRVRIVALGSGIFCVL